MRLRKLISFSLTLVICIHASRLKMRIIEILGSVQDTLLIDKGEELLAGTCICSTELSVDSKPAVLMGYFRFITNLRKKLCFYRAQIFEQE